MLLWIANLVSAASPLTRFFSLRRAIYRMAGVSISKTSKICGTTRIHNKNTHIGTDSWVGARNEIISTRNAPIHIGDRCDIGPGVMFVVGSHEFGPSSRRAGKGKSRPITIGNGTWIGARATILGGSTIGEGCMIAAGSVIRGSFPANVLIAGTPGKVVRHFD